MPDPPSPKRGRKPLDPTERSVSVTVKLPASQYDRLTAAARREAVTLAEALRRALRPNKEL